jgi:DNA-binding CsgD family transcriptional regulator
VTRFPDLCPHCGQALPTASAYLTPRELDVLACWYMARTVKKAARLAGIGEQRAKNLLGRARARNRVKTTGQLLALHFVAVSSAVADRMQHNVGAEEAA